MSPWSCNPHVGHFNRMINFFCPGQPNFEHQKNMGPIYFLHVCSTSGQWLLCSIHFGFQCLKCSTGGSLTSNVLELWQPAVMTINPYELWWLEKLSNFTYPTEVSLRIDAVQRNSVEISIKNAKRKINTEDFNFKRKDFWRRREGFQILLQGEGEREGSSFDLHNLHPKMGGGERLREVWRGREVTRMDVANNLYPAVIYILFLLFWK